MAGRQACAQTKRRLAGVGWTLLFVAHFPISCFLRCFAFSSFVLFLDTNLYARGGMSRLARQNHRPRLLAPLPGFVFLTKYHDMSRYPPPFFSCFRCCPPPFVCHSRPASPRGPFDAPFLPVTHPVLLESLTRGFFFFDSPPKAGRTQTAARRAADFGPQISRATCPVLSKAVESRVFLLNGPLRSFAGKWFAPNWLLPPSLPAESTPPSVIAPSFHRPSFPFRTTWRASFFFACPRPHSRQFASKPGATGGSSEPVRRRGRSLRRDRKRREKCEPLYFPSFPPGHPPPLAAEVPACWDGPSERRCSRAAVTAASS
jgi:hypothetical protein